MSAQSETAPAQESRGTSRIRVGSAPDSWGVWFPDDPEQVPWQRFLDEVSACGYEWIELGPYGYLPTDPARLADELGSRGLRSRRAPCSSTCTGRTPGTPCGTR
jgi:inosose dehydratase